MKSCEQGGVLGYLSVLTCFLELVKFEGSQIALRFIPLDAAR